LCSSVALAQSDNKNNSAGISQAEDEIFVVVEKDPEFPGGMEALYQWIGTNYQWPPTGDCQAQGTVYVTFIIEKDGSVSHAKILRDIGCGHGQAVLDMVQHMPKWKPGTQRGKKVRVQYNLPVKIQTQEP